MGPRSLGFVGVPPDDDAMTMPATTATATTPAAVQNHQRPRIEPDPSAGGADRSVSGLSLGDCTLALADGGGASSFGGGGDAGATAGAGAVGAGARLRSRSSISLMKPSTSVRALGVRSFAVRRYSRKAVMARSG